MLRPVFVLLSLIPGTSAILLGREVRGAVLLFLGLNAWNVGVLGATLLVGPAARLATISGLGLGILCSVISLVWTVVITSPSRRRRREEIADRAHRAALIAHLRGKDSEARTAVEAGLHAVADDPDLRFIDWVLALRAGGRRRAYPRLRRLRRLDQEEKWIWEVRRQEELRK